MRDLSRSRPARLRLRVRHRRRRTLGQSLVELALLAPFLLILLLGSLQVAYLGYGAVTIDTAAREAGRIASTNLSALNAIAQTGNSYTCASVPKNDSNEICKAVANNDGLFGSGATFSLVRIDINVSVSRKDSVPDDVVQIACGGTALSGTVSGIPGGGVAQISDTLNGTNATTTNTSGDYTDCVNPNPPNGQTQTITISATAGTNGQCTGSTQATLDKQGSNWIPDQSSYPITLTCPTPTPTPSPTATPSPTPTPSASPTSSPTSSATLPPVGTSPAASYCTTQNPAPGTFVTVTVQYRAGIFVPFLGALLADSGQSYKTLRASVTVRVNPCTA